MKKGDVYIVVKEWRDEDALFPKSEAFRRERYYIGRRIVVGEIGEETQLGYWKYPEVFKKLNEE